ncbi:MAG: type II toxin-antitoxin system RelE family toxin [Thermoplasmata archaeon]
MSRQLLFKSSAAREFQKLPAPIRQRMRRSLIAVAADPMTPRPGVDIKRMKGVSQVWRLRVGDYRALYEFDDRAVRVLEIGSRGNFY